MSCGLIHVSSQQVRSVSEKVDSSLEQAVSTSEGWPKKPWLKWRLVGCKFELLLSSCLAPYKAVLKVDFCKEQTEQAVQSQAGSRSARGNTNICPDLAS